jgi:hypothetical protein
MPAPWRIMPPSTTRTWPVMYRARSEDRKTTASATSSGSPTRPSGVRSAVRTSGPPRSQGGTQAQEDLGVEALRATIRVNVSMGLVLVSLVAELIFIVLVGYGLYRVLDLVR